MTENTVMRRDPPGDGLVASRDGAPLSRAADGTLARPRRRTGVISRRPPKPRLSWLSGLDFVVILLVNVLVIAGMWVIHGGLDQLGTPGGVWTAIGQLTGLYGALAILVQIVLIARIPWLERRYGMDKLNAWHRWNGLGAVLLLAVHAMAITLGYAAGAGMSIWDQLVDLVLYYPWMLSAMVGLALMIGVAVTSVRAARRALSYEAWWFIHLYAYLAVGLAFFHQIATGADFVNDPWARGYWIALHVVVAVLLVGYRWLEPTYRAVRHRLRVSEVIHESSDVVTVVLTGRKLHRLPVESGQFFLLRFLTTDRWWKAHPFSISSAPDGRTLRFTIKAEGDDTEALQSIEIGTLVAAEGPYGAFTAAKATKRKVALIAGGIGIAPIRALYEDLDRRPGEVSLLYRARRASSAVFQDELRELSAERGFDLKISYSRIPKVGIPAESNPFRPEALTTAIPDISKRSVFICGSPSLIASAISGLRAAGVPKAQIHSERFDY